MKDGMKKEWSTTASAGRPAPGIGMRIYPVDISPATMIEGSIRSPESSRVTARPDYLLHLQTARNATLGALPNSFKLQKVQEYFNTKWSILITKQILILDNEEALSLIGWVL